MMSLITSNFVRSLFHAFKDRYTFYSRKKAFEKRYKNISHELFKNNLSKKVVEEYLKKWSVFNVNVELKTFFLCNNLSDSIDSNIIPEDIFAAIIEPRLNKYWNKQLSFISTKNIYEKWFENGQVFPKSYFHKIDNIYYDSKLNIINNIDLYLTNINFDFPLICKPSIGTFGGVGVVLLHNLEEVKESLNTYENLVYQEKIEQNKFLDEINPGMNTIRTCLYREKSGSFQVLNNSIRFGIDGGLDNATGGGIVCNIDENGVLNKYAVNKYCNKYLMHPNSGVIFEGIKIPFFNQLIELSEKIANEIPLCNLVSLDMCLDAENKWRCIEVNLEGQTIRFSQYAGKSFFGKYTDEVLERVLSKK